LHRFWGVAGGCQRLTTWPVCRSVSRFVCRSHACLPVPPLCGCSRTRTQTQPARCPIHTRSTCWLPCPLTRTQMACGAPPHADMHPMRVLFLIPRDPPPCLEGPFSDTFKSFVATCLQVRNACVCIFTYVNLVLCGASNAPVCCSALLRCHL
jgi:hypothetical protein